MALMSGWSRPGGEMAFGSIISLFAYLVVFYIMFTTSSFWTNG